MRRLGYFVLSVASLLGCGESSSGGAPRTSGHAGSGGGAGTGTAGMPSAGTGGTGGIIDMTPDFTLPPLPANDAADLSLTDENEGLFYRMAVNAMASLQPMFHDASLSRALLLDGTPLVESSDFSLTPECVDQTIDLGGFIRTACGNFLGEYQRMEGTDGLRLEYRFRQDSGWVQRQAQTSEYVVQNGLLTAALSFELNLVQFDSSPIFWTHTVALYRLRKDLFAGRSIDVWSNWFVNLDPIEIALDVHVQSVQKSPIGYVYSSLTGFDGHFSVDLVRSETPPKLVYKITDHAGTTRCFFGKTEQVMAPYHLDQEFFTDRNCDGTSEGTIAVPAE
jgi:hypothetical protein